MDHGTKYMIGKNHLEANVLNKYCTSKITYNEIPVDLNTLFQEGFRLNKVLLDKQYFPLHSLCICDTNDKSASLAVYVHYTVTRAADIFSSSLSLKMETVLPSETLLSICKPTKLSNSENQH